MTRLYLQKDIAKPFVASCEELGIKFRLHDKDRMQEWGLPHSIEMKEEDFNLIKLTVNRFTLTETKTGDYWVY